MLTLCKINRNIDFSCRCEGFFSVPELLFLSSRYAMLSFRIFPYSISTLVLSQVFKSYRWNIFLILSPRKPLGSVTLLCFGVYILYEEKMKEIKKKNFSQNGIQFPLRIIIIFFCAFLFFIFIFLFRC